MIYFIIGIIILTIMWGINYYLLYHLYVKNPKITIQPYSWIYIDKTDISNQSFDEISNPLLWIFVSFIFWPIFLFLQCVDYTRIVLDYFANKPKKPSFIPRIAEYFDRKRNPEKYI